MNWGKEKSGVIASENGSVEVRNEKRGWQPYRLVQWGMRPFARFCGTMEAAMLSAEREFNR